MGLVSLAAFANSLGNGFAMDDNWFIVENDVVTEGRFAEAFTDAAWPGAREGTGNYRPVTLASFAAEWALWGDRPLGYHVVSVVVHTGVSLLVLAFLSSFLPLLAATAGAAFFAVHPVHVEAVANVMGRAELYAAAAYLVACLLYLRGAPSGGGARAVRLVGLLLLYALAAGAKEIAVTLPGMLLVLELLRRSPRPLLGRLRDEAPTYAALFALMGVYVIVRWNAVGDLTGEGAAAGLLSLDTSGRLLSALTVWPHYVRLLLFPVDLSSDYSPAVLVPTTTVTVQVILGAALLVGTIAGAIGLRNRNPAAAAGLAWFVVAISPVSNLLVRADVLLAERTLYLPSVGAALVVAALANHFFTADDAAVRRAAAAAAIVACALLMTRTVARNPTWLDTFTVLETLAREHPEAWSSQRAFAVGYERIGDFEAAERAWSTALVIAPDHYQLLVESALFYDGLGRHDRAEELFERAIALVPDRPEAYANQAERRIVRGDGRGAHAAAVRGVAAVGANRHLWALVSETYVMKLDLEAALRARLASIAAEPTEAGWRRLAELLDALDRDAEAAQARAEAQRLASRAGPAAGGG